MEPTADGAPAARKRPHAAKAAAEDDEVVVPSVSTRKRSRRVPTGSGSEFVDVEVGLRELHRRLATTGDGPAASGAGSTKRSNSNSSRSREKPLAAVDQAPPSKRKAPTEQAASTRSFKPKLPPRAKAATTTSPGWLAIMSRGVATDSTTAAPATAAPSGRAQGARGARRGAAAAPSRSRQAPTTSRKPRTTPKKTRQETDATPTGALAVARAEAARQQQARVQARVLTLQPLPPTKDDGRDPARTAISVAVESTSSGRADAAQRELAVSPATAVVSVSSPPAREHPECTQDDAAEPSSQGFIAEDVDEDLAFLHALEEVERQLQPATLNAPSSPLVSRTTSEPPAVGTSTSPAAPPRSEQTSSPPIRQQPMSGASTGGLADETHATPAPTTPTPTPTSPSSSVPAAAPLPLDIMAEFERLKRENEALRRSNEQLQVAAAAGIPEEPPSGAQNEPMLIKTEPQSTNNAPAPTASVELIPSAEAGTNANAAATSTPAASTENERHAHVVNDQRGKVEPTSRRTEDNDPRDPPARHDLDADATARVNVNSVDRGRNSDSSEEEKKTPEEGDGRVDDDVGGDDDEGNDEEEDDEDDEEDADADAERDELSMLDVGYKTRRRERGGKGHDGGNDGDADEGEGDDDDDDDADDDRGASYAKLQAAAQRHQLYQKRRAEAVVARAAGVTASRQPGPSSSSKPDSGVSSSVPLSSLRHGSDTETDDDDDDDDPQRPGGEHPTSSESSDDEPLAGVSGLEAALRAATGQTTTATPRARPSVPRASLKQPATPSPSVESSTVDNGQLHRDRSGSDIDSGPGAPSRKRGRSIDIKPEPRQDHNVGTPKPLGRKRRAATGTPTASARDRATMLWPTLDDFYDFVLDLSPRRILHSTPAHCRVLSEYERARARLPEQYPDLTHYCDVQSEAILEELVGSVRNAEEMALHNSHRVRLWLSSISPCGAAAATSSKLVQSGGVPQDVLLESGFSGQSAPDKNDYILTFEERRAKHQRSVLGDFVGGDLVVLRSPEWRGYDVYAFGIVLCSSTVAVGGSASSSSGGKSAASNQPEQLCLLVRGPSGAGAGEDLGRFEAVMEMCLVNQRAAAWQWSLEQVHNLTTSTREYQAIKSIRFLKAETKEMLISGIIPQVIKSEQTLVVEPRNKLTPGLYEHLETKYNPSQLQAILGGISDQTEISIIQGPPGTGKTKTILGLLSALLDGAAISSSRQTQVKTKIRIGASLQENSSGKDKKSVAQSSIRILVAAPSNAAVDELIVRLLSEGIYDARQRKSYRPRLVRVGRPESLQQQQQQQQQQQHAHDRKHADITKKKTWRKYATEVEEILLESLVNKLKTSFPTAKHARQAIIQNAQIVFCTLSGAGSQAMCELQQQQFDALVIDEAAQAVEASLLIPFKFQPGRVILVGDHRQLPATVISKRLLELGYDRSLFQRLVENGSRVFLLAQQYRMHPEISWFPSSYFYRGKLVEAPEMKQFTARKYHEDRAFRPFVFYDVLGGRQSQVSGSKSLRNLSEIEFIVGLLHQLVIKTYPELEWRRKIGIIAPYKQQIYELRAELQRWEARHDRRLEIEVNTVDGFQGREKEIIIYSCVRTSQRGRPVAASGGRGGRHHHSRQQGQGQGQAVEAFWADERRMNVAITRAKCSLWIIGNSSLLQQSPAWRALLQHAKDTRRYHHDLPSP